MDNRGQIGQIAELIDMLSAKGVKQVRVSGFAGTGELELQLGLPPVANALGAPSYEPSDEDIQYAATGLVPINLREMVK